MSWLSMNSILLVHVVAGALAVLGGAVAFAAPKGGTTHRTGGKLFVASMLVCAAAGAYAGYFNPKLFITVFAGLVAAYLVVSGWLTVARAPGKAGVWEGLIFSVGLGAGVGLYSLGFQALNSPTGMSGGFGWDAYAFLGTVAMLGAGLDLSVMVRRGLAGRQRITRHLWRMGFGYFMAVGSLFTGPGAKAFPEALRASGALSAPELIVAALTIFWVVRVLLGRSWRTAPAA